MLMSPKGRKVRSVIVYEIAPSLHGTSPPRHKLTYTGGLFSLLTLKVVRTVMNLSARKIPSRRPAAPIYPNPYPGKEHAMQPLIRFRLSASTNESHVTLESLNQRINDAGMYTLRRDDGFYGRPCLGDKYGIVSRIVVLASHGTAVSHVSVWSHQIRIYYAAGATVEQIRTLIARAVNDTPLAYEFV